MTGGAALGATAEHARRRLVELIASGSLRSGQRLGAERDLAVQLGVSRSTLRRALGVLERDGAIRRMPGRSGGTFVTAAKLDRDLSQIVGVPALLRDQGFLAGSRVLSAGVVVADAVTGRALALEPGDFVHDLVRIRLADGAPISLEHARFPAERFPDLLEQPLGGSIYELLEQRYGTVPAEAEERIEARGATPDEARVLEVKAGVPLLEVTRTALDAGHRPIEFSHDLFRGDRTLVTVRTQGRTGAAVCLLQAPGRLVEKGRARSG